MALRLPRWSVPLGAAAILLATAAPASADIIVDPGPIAPNQLFTAFVNDHSGQSRIAVTCDGPIDVVPTGHPVAGQTVVVVQSSAPGTTGDGFTGSAGKAIDVSVGGASSPTTPVQLRFYRQRALIPTDVVVPCGGGGVVTFVPDPASSTARRALVKVTFVTQP